MRAILFLCLLLVGCNHLQDNAYYAHPTSCITSDFSILEQPDDISCGPTSVTMLLKYAGQNIAIEEVKVTTKTKWFSYNGKDFGMTSPECVALALAKYGVKAKIKDSNLSALKHYVSQGRLPIALMRSDKCTWHYVVVIGYTETDILVADPGRPHSWMTTDQFLGAWSFKTDMYGECVLSKCTACNGKGRRLNLPFDQCNACKGSGKRDNWLPSFMTMFNANPYTLIVPNTTLK